MGNKSSSIERLKKEGWTRRSTASEPRLSECVELYRNMGFDVWLEPIAEYKECHPCCTESNNDSCQICFEGVEDQYKIIFTKPKKD